MSNDTFVLGTGQAHELEMAFRRTGWDNAEVKILCTGNNLALVKDLISGKLDYQYKQPSVPVAAPPPQPLLIPVGTVNVAATAAPFVARDHFVVDTKKGTAVKISYLGDNFKAWFLGKTEAPFAGSTLRYGKLSRYSLDAPIITELGGEEKAETTLAELFSLMEKQPNGESGTSLTNGYANIFYIKDANGVLRAVSALWGGGGWDVGATAVTNPFEWVGGFRVFSRDSR